MKPFDTAAYRAELLDVASLIEPFASHVSIRSDGQAQFVFSESRNGAVELSKTQHLQVFPELWRPGSTEPTREETHSTYESAIASALAWLRAG